MKKPVKLTILALALGGAGFLGYDYLTEGRYQVATDNAYLKADNVDVASKAAGYVVNLAFKENQIVRKGDRLIVLDHADLDAKLAQAEAALSAQEAAIATLNKRIAWQSQNIAQAGTGKIFARADVERTAKDFKRVMSLRQKDVVSSQRLDLIAADTTKARAQLKGAEVAIRAEQDQLEILKTSLVEAQALLKQRQAAVELARVERSYAEIVAPSDGVVGNKAVELGQYVRPGAHLFTIVPLHDVYVVANFKETQIEHLRFGQKVEVTLDAFNDQTIEGRVDSFAPASGAEFSLLPPENATGNFTKVVQRIPVKITFSDPEVLKGLLRPGLSAEVSIDSRDQSGHEPISGNAFQQHYHTLTETAAR